MKYRQLGNTGLSVSEVGLGCEHLQGKPREQVESVVRAALDGGVNILDVFMGEPEIRTNIGRAIRSRRSSVLLQGHIGAIWKNGQYAKSRDLNECSAFFDDFLSRYQTDYIDLGMLHYVDKPDEWDKLSGGALMEYIQALKASGRVRAVGLSSHNPVTVKAAALSGLIDLVMFSVNPAFDLLPSVHIDDLFESQTYAGGALAGVNAERAEMYRVCERMGVGITVMKCFGGGMLLNDKASPFGKALTPHQLMAYALERPAVSSVLVGCQTPEEVERALAFESASDEAKDYAMALTGLKYFPVDGRCMYCNHCLPCPAKLDIAAINRYLDAALVSGGAPETIKAHYIGLEHTAEACAHCGACEERCPFGVKIRARMDKAREVFGS